MRIKIVGCGLSAITAAVVLKDKGHDVTVFEIRNHIGGNCYDTYVNNTLTHCYGPHTFHTDDEEVFSFLSRFTAWYPFLLRPKGNTEIGLISLPYSQTTIAELGRELSEAEIVEYIFKGYSEKQWGLPFNQIPSFITNRIPKTKHLTNPTWFEGQKYQCVPLRGYTYMFHNMLDGITVELGCDVNEWRTVPCDLTIYTGKIDEYFAYCYGRLPYRSLDFQHQTSSERQTTFIINQNKASVPHTRCYDHSYFNPVHQGPTIITYEYSKPCGDNDIPFYPIPFGDGLALYERYKGLAQREKNVIFLGRLATYKYLDMWMAVKQVLNKLASF